MSKKSIFLLTILSLLFSGSIANAMACDDFAAAGAVEAVLAKRLDEASAIVDRQILVGEPKQISKEGDLTDYETVISVIENNEDGAETVTRYYVNLDVGSNCDVKEQSARIELGN